LPRPRDDRPLTRLTTAIVGNKLARRYETERSARDELLQAYQVDGHETDIRIHKEQKLILG
jgi:hypothetical protein